MSASIRALSNSSLMVSDDCSICSPINMMMMMMMMMMTMATVMPEQYVYGAVIVEEPMQKFKQCKEAVTVLCTKLCALFSFC